MPPRNILVLQLSLVDSEKNIIVALRGRNWTFHVECDVSSINRRRVPHHTRLKSNFDRLLYIIFLFHHILFSLYKREGIESKAFKKQNFEKKLDKNFWKKNVEKKLLKKFLKQKCWEKTFKKIFETKMLKQKFWEENSKKKFGKKIKKKNFWKKMLTKKCWKNELQNKNIHNQNL